MKRRKHKTDKQQLEAIANRLLSIVVRYGAADEWGICACVTCGTKMRWDARAMHAGHFVSRRFTATKYLLMNVHPQCYVCNIRLYGNWEEYRDWMVREYGSKMVEKLLAERHHSFTVTVSWLHLVIDSLKAELAELGFLVSDDCKEVILDAKALGKKKSHARSAEPQAAAAEPAPSAAEARSVAGRDSR